MNASSSGRQQSRNYSIGLPFYWIRERQRIRCSIQSRRLSTTCDTQSNSRSPISGVVRLFSIRFVYLASWNNRWYQTAEGGGGISRVKTNSIDDPRFSRSFSRTRGWTKSLWSDAFKVVRAKAPSNTIFLSVQRNQHTLSGSSRSSPSPTSASDLSLCNYIEPWRAFRTTRVSSRKSLQRKFSAEVPNISFVNTLNLCRFIFFRFQSVIFSIVFLPWSHHLHRIICSMNYLQHYRLRTPTTAALA